MASDPGMESETQEDPHVSGKFLGLYYRDNRKSLRGILADKLHNCNKIFKKSLARNYKDNARRSQIRGRNTSRKNLQ